MARPLKIMVIGPSECGKSAISDFLADRKLNLETADYHPTMGVRILEFTREIKLVEARSSTLRVNVELWDCAGDKKYATTWPAIIRDADGALLVFNPEARNAEKELEMWYTRLVHPAGLKDAQCLIFAHNRSNDQQAANKLKIKLPKSMSNITMISTSLSYDADTCKYEFDYLLASIAKAVAEKRERDELNIING